MSASTDKPDPFDPFGILASMTEWCCLLKAAHELRDVDEEMLESMLGASTPGGAPLASEAAAKLRGLAGLMRELRLDPEALRRREPALTQALEAACLQCSARERCERDLRSGTAARTYREFCPNAPSLDRLCKA